MKKVIDIDEAKNKLISMDEFRHYKNYINDALAGDFACELINLLNGYKEEPVQKWRKAEFPRDWGKEVYFGVAEVAGTLDGFCKRENKFIGSGWAWKICQILDDSEGEEQEERGGWINWKGGDCPVNHCTIIERKNTPDTVAIYIDWANSFTYRIKSYKEAVKDEQILDESEGGEEEVKAVCGGCEAELKDGEYCDNTDCKLFWKATKEPQALQQRIEAQFPDKRVEMLERTATALKIDTGSSMMYHIVAPSLRGFAGFVYEHDKGVFTENLNACVRGYKEVKTRFPIAVLFEADK